MANVTVTITSAPREGVDGFHLGPGWHWHMVHNGKTVNGAGESDTFLHAAEAANRALNQQAGERRRDQRVRADFVVDKQFSLRAAANRTLKEWSLKEQADMRRKAELRKDELVRADFGVPTPVPAPVPVSAPVPAPVPAPATLPNRNYKKAAQPKRKLLAKLLKRHA